MVNLCLSFEVIEISRNRCHNAVMLHPLGGIDAELAS
jgi:hypothetical protein